MKNRQRTQQKETEMQTNEKKVKMNLILSLVESKRERENSLLSPRFPSSANHDAHRLTYI